MKLFPTFVKPGKQLTVSMEATVDLSCMPLLLKEIEKQHRFSLLPEQGFFSHNFGLEIWFYTKLLICAGSELTWQILTDELLSTLLLVWETRSPHKPATKSDKKVKRHQSCGEVHLVMVSSKKLKSRKCSTFSWRETLHWQPAIQRESSQPIWLQGWAYVFFLQ